MEKMLRPAADVLTTRAGGRTGGCVPALNSTKPHAGPCDPAYSLRRTRRVRQMVWLLYRLSGVRHS